MADIRRIFSILPSDIRRMVGGYPTLGYRGFVLRFSLFFRVLIIHSYLNFNLKDDINPLLNLLVLKRNGKSTCGK